ncbi:hypothetical protein EVAR_69079_1 [Eumeta japonica]|uniref:Uncharacterized protein n=1 Tax=Eumeta variegata TaxID=151549 RepID=A0A4C1ZI17_EUMVA|nr:hypothetical protein EVAR_69079_1 [Eumeta japonica]
MPGDHGTAYRSNKDTDGPPACVLCKQKAIRLTILMPACSKDLHPRGRAAPMSARAVSAAFSYAERRLDRVTPAAKNSATSADDLSQLMSIITVIDTSELTILAKILSRGRVSFVVKIFTLPQTKKKINEAFSVVVRLVRSRALEPDHALELRRAFRLSNTLRPLRPDLNPVRSRFSRLVFIRRPWSPPTPRRRDIIAYARRLRRPRATAAPPLRAAAAWHVPASCRRIVFRAAADCSRSIYGLGPGFVDVRCATGGYR